MSFTWRANLRGLNQFGEQYMSVKDYVLALSLASEDPNATPDEVRTLRNLRDVLLRAEWTTL